MDETLASLSISGITTLSIGSMLAAFTGLEPKLISKAGSDSVISPESFSTSLAGLETLDFLTLVSGSTTQAPESSNYRTTLLTFNGKSFISIIIFNPKILI